MRSYKEGEAGLQAVLKEAEIPEYDNVQAAEEEVIAFLIIKYIEHQQGYSSCFISDGLTYKQY